MPPDEPNPPLRALLAGIERARKLTFLTLAALALGTALGWVKAREVFEILARPLTDELMRRGQDPRLGFTGLADPFVLYFTVSLLCGLVVATPVLVTQLWIVIAPRVRRRSALAAVLFVLSTSSLFVSGLAFCYVVLLPVAVRYLLGVGGDFETAITVRDFLAFAVRLMVALGAAAQLPLITFVAARFGLVTARTLLRWIPYAAIGAFVLGAWLSPPDVLSQFLVALPLLGLYLLGIGVAALAARGATRDS